MAPRPSGPSACRFPGCNVMMTSMSDNHEREHDGKWLCDRENCGKTYKTINALNKHIRGVHEKSVICRRVLDDGSQCGMAFGTTQQLTNHHATQHDREILYECSKCPQTSYHPDFPKNHRCRPKTHQHTEAIVQKEQEIKKAIRDDSTKQMMQRFSSSAADSQPEVSDQDQDVPQPSLEDFAESLDTQLQLQAKQDTITVMLSDGFSEPIVRHITTYNNLMREHYPTYPLRLKPGKAIEKNRVLKNINGRDEWVTKDFFECSGPAPGAKCPHTERLTLENAKLTPDTERNVLKLITQCYLCRSVRSRLLHANSLSKLTTRLAAGLCVGTLRCSDPVVEGDKRCAEHAAAHNEFKQSIFYNYKKMKTESTPVDAVLKMNHELEAKLIDRRLPAIWNDVRLMSLETLIGNTEFGFLAHPADTSRNVFIASVALVHFTTGQILEHCIIDYSQSRAALLLNPALVALKGARKVTAEALINRWYRDDGPGKGVRRLTPKQFAARLQQLDFSSKTFIEWSSSGCDINNIRDLITNYTDFDPDTLLPPPERCLSALSLLMYDIPSLNKLPYDKGWLGSLKLEPLYEILIGGEYVGRHHEAHVDAIKTGQVLQKMLGWCGTDL